MAKKIPHKDKAIIKKRLAQGQSQREAIKGTVVESHTTAGLLAKNESTTVDRLKKEYVALIEKFEAGDIDRAKLLAEMTRATKIHTSHTEPDREVPDWSRRFDSIKYIDKLKDYSEDGNSGQQQAQQTNVYVNAQKDIDKFIVKEEVNDGKS